MIKLSIIIPTYERMAKLTRQLENLEKEIFDYKDYCEIIVCDNSKIPVVIELSSPQVYYYWNEGNIGLSGSVSRLFNLARGMYSWLLSDDDEIKSGTIKSILEIIDRSLNGKSTELIVIESSASYRGEIFKKQFYFEFLNSNTLTPYEFLEGYWISLFFISIVVYKTESAKKQILKMGSLNRVYPQTQISWALLLESNDSVVSIIRKPCVIDNYGVKSYRKSDINCVSVLEMANLINLINTEIIITSRHSKMLQSTVGKMNNLLIRNIVRYGLMSVIASKLWPIYRNRYKQDYIEILKYSFGIRYKFIVYSVLLLLKVPILLNIIVFLFFWIKKVKLYLSAIEKDLLEITGSECDVSSKHTIY
jgi:glycosyltransferase involved in cell wall biosynthesis